jgi:hypothetical protein
MTKPKPDLRTTTTAARKEENGKDNQAKRRLELEPTPVAEEKRAAALTFFYFYGLSPFFFALICIGSFYFICFYFLFYWIRFQNKLHFSLKMCNFSWFSAQVAVL